MTSLSVQEIFQSSYITSDLRKFIFIPVGGQGYDMIYSIGTIGEYWCVKWASSSNSFILEITSSTRTIGKITRYYGFSVRPIR